MSFLGCFIFNFILFFSFILLDKYSLTSSTCFSDFVHQFEPLGKKPFLLCCVNNLSSMTQGYALMIVSIKACTFSYKASITKRSFQQFQLIPSSVTQEARRMNVSWRRKGNLLVKAMRLSHVM